MHFVSRAPVIYDGFDAFYDVFRSNLTAFQIPENMKKPLNRAASRV